MHIHTTNLALPYTANRTVPSLDEPSTDFYTWLGSGCETAADLSGKAFDDSNS
jgi:hypothetical protein